MVSTMNPVSADKDFVVPTADQLELAQILNAEVHLRLEGEHVSVVKQAFFMQRQKIVRFFGKNLLKGKLTSDL